MSCSSAKDRSLAPVAVARFAGGMPLFDFAASKRTKDSMRHMIQRAVIGSALVVALWTAQTALGWYDPSTQRWLTRDPLGEPGFQAIPPVQPTS